MVERMDSRGRCIACKKVEKEISLETRQKEIASRPSPFQALFSLDPDNRHIHCFVLSWPIVLFFVPLSFGLTKISFHRFFQIHKERTSKNLANFFKLQSKSIVPICG